MDMSDLEDLVSTPMLELGARFARAGMRVFPVDMRPDAGGKARKSPPHGYLWKERASSRVNEVVEDLVAAIETLGESSVGIGWALGLDGCLALDLDGAEPPWWTDLLADDVAVNVTARGLHLVYRQPDGRRIGNGTGGFPSTGWGEVRGHGGYVIVAGPDRPGFDVEQLSRVRAFPRPEWLTDAGAEALPLDDAELRAWLEDHSRTPSVRGRVAGFTTALAAATGSRHETAVRVACWMAREVGAGVVNALEAFELLASWWRTTSSSSGRQLTDRELASVIRWSVAVAVADPERLEQIASEAHAWDAEARATSERMAELVAAGAPAATDDPFASCEPDDLEPWLAGTAATIVADLLRLPDGRALLHAGRLNGVHGDSGAGKSWIIPLAIRELAEAGRRVLVIDLEDTPAPLITRLRQIGVSDEAIRSSLVFVRPDVSLLRGGAGRLVEVARRERVAHVFVDSLGEAFALDGIDENADAEVAPWLLAVVRRMIEQTGAGVTLIDHVTKALENPLHPSGSKRKRAAITGTSWLLVALEPFTLELGGRVALRCGKDRHGVYRRGDTVAELVMGPLDVTTGHSTLELEAPAVEESISGSSRDPLDVIVELLETYGEHNATALEALASRVAGWPRGLTRETRELALRRGLIVRRIGERGARLFSSPPAADCGGLD